MTSASTQKTSLRTAEIHLREDGIVHVKIRKGIVQTMDDARLNLDTAVALRGGQKRPILIDLRVAEPLETVIRHHYSGTKLSEWFDGLALVVSGSPFGRMMGNIYLKVAKPYVPIRLFEDPDVASSWLREIAIK